MGFLTRCSHPKPNQHGLGDRLLLPDDDGLSDDELLPDDELPLLLLLDDELPPLLLLGVELPPPDDDLPDDELPLLLDDELLLDVSPKTVTITFSVV